MKPSAFKIFFAFATLVLSVSVAFAQKHDKAKVERAEELDDPQTTRMVAADPGIVVTMCLESGNIVVVGGDGREVRVTAERSASISLRPMEGGKTAAPATRVEVVVIDSQKEDVTEFGECRGSSDVDIEVPRGATLYVTTRDGDIDISNVSEVRAETTGGNISLRRIGRAVEAATVGGDISLEESAGRIRLRSISGSIDAIKAKAVEGSDFLFVKTISGDVRLEQVSQPRVEAGTITGEISLAGPLAQGGFYGFNTVTGDVTLTMPDSVSFEVTAKVSQGGEVITDFPLKYADGISTRDVMSSGKLAGSYGAGSSPAKLNLVSFSGTLRLRKK